MFRALSGASENQTPNPNTGNTSALCPKPKTELNAKSHYSMSLRLTVEGIERLRKMLGSVVCLLVLYTSTNPTSLSYHGLLLHVTSPIKLCSTVLSACLYPVRIMPYSYTVMLWYVSKVLYQATIRPWLAAVELQLRQKPGGAQGLHKFVG